MSKMKSKTPSRLRKLVQLHYYTFITNGILFLSSLFLLIDVAPKDFSPTYKKQIEAVSKLRTDRNILGINPPGYNIKPETQDMRIVWDTPTYEILKSLIIDFSPYVKSIRWDKAIGVGYAVQSLPVGRNKLEAFRPLYIVEIPMDGNSSQLNLNPVGQLQDLDVWLSTQRQSSLTIAALILLVIGFFLQLLESYYKSKTDYKMINL
jgi:hypothetical protein